MKLEEMQSVPATYIEAEASESIDPFDSEIISRILAPADHNPNQLAFGETNLIEFKENFGLNSLPAYARTMAAFANAKGGYIIFGVSNHPKVLVGLVNEAFDKFDAAKLTGAFNDHFSPKISFRKHFIWVGTKKIGFIYTYPAIVKPVMAKRDKSPEIREGEIYYRYEARTEKIKYPELRSIIDDQRRRETELWLKYITRIARIGVDNAAIVDSATGEAIGSTSKTTFLDEKTLEQLQFVNEAQLHQSDGAPALTLVGDMQEVPPGIKPQTIIEKVEVPVEIHIDRLTPIRTHDIVGIFLRQEIVANPQMYIEQLCFLESGNLPIYYFGKLARLNYIELAKIIQSVRVPSLQTKKTILRRLGDERENYSKTLMLNELPLSQKKKQIYDELLSETLNPNVEYQDVAHVLQTIRCLNYREIKPLYLFPIILNLYEKFYTVREIKSLSDDFRRVLCHIDCVLYQDEVRI